MFRAKIITMFLEDLKQKYPYPIKFLSKAIKEKKLANSYVFIGNDENDTCTIARALSMILNCSKNKLTYTEPCNNCLNCKWISKNEHPNAFILVTPEVSSKKEQIKVENIRNILTTLTISSENYRVIFFQKASMTTLPPECCNLLLKTVEEAPQNALFIFGSNIKDDILPTILSRSQIIYLCKVKNAPFSQSSASEALLTDLFSNHPLEILKKTKDIMQKIEESELQLKEFLFAQALTEYEKIKYTNGKKFYFLFNKLNEAFLKSKAFMQPKYIIEDLLLELKPFSQKLRVSD